MNNTVIKVLNTEHGRKVIELIMTMVGDIMMYVFFIFFLKIHTFVEFGLEQLMMVISVLGLNANQKKKL